MTKSCRLLTFQEGTAVLSSPVFHSHKLSHLIRVEEIVTADYVRGTLVGREPHIHEKAWELIFCDRNEMMVLIDGETRELKDGNLFFIRPGIRHTIMCGSDDSRTFVISFTCSNPNLLLPLEERILAAGAEEQHFLEKILSELENAYIRAPGCLHLFSFESSDRAPLGAEQAICCYLELLIIDILRSTAYAELSAEIHSESQKGSETDEVPESGDIGSIVRYFLVKEVNRYIIAHLGEPLSVQQIAARFHYSRSRFSIVYKELTGKTVGEQINELRLNYAKQLLSRGELNIGEIAERSGFSSAQYFSHKFQKKVGMTPGEYMRNKRKDDTEVFTNAEGLRQT